MRQLSADPLTSCFMLGLKAQLNTVDLWPRKVRSRVGSGIVGADILF